MPAFISPLDGNYISLKRAALLIAGEQPGIEPDDIMELFKHAIFTSARNAAFKEPIRMTIGTCLCSGSKRRRALALSPGFRLTLSRRNISR